MSCTTPTSTLTPTLSRKREREEDQIWSPLPLAGEGQGEGPRLVDARLRERFRLGVQVAARLVQAIGQRGQRVGVIDGLARLARSDLSPSPACGRGWGGWG